MTLRDPETTGRRTAPSRGSSPTGRAGAARPLVRDRRLLVGAVVAAAVFVILLALVLLAERGPLPVDLWWQHQVSALRGPAATAVLTTVSDVGAGLVGMVVVPLVIVVGLVARGRRAEAVTFAVAVAVSTVAVPVVKDLVARPRPGGQTLETTFAFPSGHVTHAATVTVLLAVLLHRRRLVALAVLWTTLMAVSRTALGVHWLTDTLAGAALGTALALTAALVHDLVVRRRAGSPGRHDRRPARPTPGAPT